MYQKLRSDDVRFMRYGARRTDKQMDGKGDIKRWVPHLKTDASGLRFTEENPQENKIF